MTVLAGVFVVFVVGFELAYVARRWRRAREVLLSIGAWERARRQ